MVDFKGEYPPVINLGYMNASDKLKIRLLIPNTKISKPIELHQGTYAN